MTDFNKSNILSAVPDSWFGIISKFCITYWKIRLFWTQCATFRTSPSWLVYFADGLKFIINAERLQGCYRYFDKFSFAFIRIVLNVYTGAVETAPLYANFILCAQLRFCYYY